MTWDGPAENIIVTIWYDDVISYGTIEDDIRFYNATYSYMMCAEIFWYSRVDKRKDNPMTSYIIMEYLVQNHTR